MLCSSLRYLVIAGALGLTVGTATVRAETVLRVAMSAADIPDWTGGPDQGYEGFRFVGFSIYDSLIEWDLSHSDRAADIRPAHCNCSLATPRPRPNPSRNFRT